MDSKNPHTSEVSEPTSVIRVRLLHLNVFWVIAEGQLYSPNGRRLLIFARINDAVFVR